MGHPPTGSTTRRPGRWRLDAPAWPLSISSSCLWPGGWSRPPRRHRPRRRRVLRPRHHRSSDAGATGHLRDPDQRGRHHRACRTGSATAPDRPSLVEPIQPGPMLWAASSPPEHVASGCPRSKSTSKRAGRWSSSTVHSPSFAMWSTMRTAWKRWTSPPLDEEHPAMDGAGPVDR